MTKTARNKAELEDLNSDKFYTKESVAKSLTELLNFDDYDFIIEPSAGSGSFSKLLPKDKSVALDLFPEGDEIIQADWFEYKVDTKYKSVLVIGNPPFGKNNILSAQFIKHSTSFNNVETVAFILPDVYKKHTLQKYIPKEYKIVKIVKLPRNAFTLSGNTHHVPCSFFIMRKNSNERDLRQNPNKRSRDFDFSNKADYDFFIFGAAPKKIIDVPSSNNRGYFIKSKIDAEILRKRFQKMRWEGKSSANGGVYWLTKVDIVENYNKNKRMGTWNIEN